MRRLRIHISTKWEMSKVRHSGPYRMTTFEMTSWLDGMIDSLAKPGCQFIFGAIDCEY